MLFEDFDFSLLDNPSFKEDSVREELITPLLKALGYSASPPNRIRRSVSLTHPYVYMGSKPNKIYIIPDYLLEKDNKKFFVLDAKAPNEEIFQGKNVEQAYSYAMHPDIRVNYYALCNGRDFALYDTQEVECILKFALNEISEHISDLSRIIGTSASTVELNFRPDWGLYLFEIGQAIADDGVKYQQVHVPLEFDHVSKVNDDLYSFQCPIVTEDGIKFLGTFDFDASLLPGFLDNMYPSELAPYVHYHLKRQPYRWHHGGEISGFIGVVAEVGDAVCFNKKERYLPLQVMEFFSLFPEQKAPATE